MSRAVTEPNSADDINNILKRRGQKMFEQSGNQKKLEELDIDSVLENAEEHKTEQAAGLTSDGGAEFLKNFEYTDVKIDLEWDDIIPKEELEAVKAEIQQRKDDEQTQKLLDESAPRKRKAAAASAREQRAAKKRAMEASRDVDVDDDEPSEDENVKRDPRRPLNTKETRNLVRAYERYGSLEDRTEDMLKAAKLVGRDLDIVKNTLNTVITTSQDLVKQEQARLKKLEIDENRAITKKDKKAVLFDFNGVKKLNAETIIDRPVEMRILKEAVQGVQDWHNFRIADAIKPASYSCPWGAREDGMLSVGISRHGYGAWVQIRDDPELGLTDKFFLEEHRVDKKEERTKGEEKNAKSPGAVHLVRRANYLLTVLKDKTGADPNAKRLMENHHRNNKKHHLNAARRTDKASSVSASPAPPGQARKVVARDMARPIQRTHSNSESRRSEGRPEHREREKPRHSDQYRPSEGHRRDDRGSVDRRSEIPDRTETPDFRRKPSGDLERQRSRDDRPRPSEERPRAPSQSQNPNRSVDLTPKGSKEKKPEDFVERKMRPVRDNLSRLKKATAKNYPQKEIMIKVLKTELIAIGNFIRAETRDNAELEDRLW
jgi:chromodomain-helicase-DNA-binding protein 1